MSEVTNVDKISDNRVHWVDICRVLAMLAIMILHTPTDHGWVTCITRAGVAFFFLMSGYFVALKTPTTRSVLKRGGHMFITYILWVCVYGLWFKRDVFTDPLLFIEGLGMGSTPSVSIVLWFLRDLTIITLVSAFLVRLDRKILFILAILLGALFASCRSTGEGILELTHPRSFAWFFLGMALSSVSLAQIKTFCWKYRYVILSSFVIAFCYQGWHQEIHESFNMLVITVAGLFVLSMAIEKYFFRFSSYISSWGKAIFFVYLTHSIFYNIISKIFYRFFTSAVPEWLWFCLVPFIMAFLVYIYKFIDAYFPRLNYLIALSNKPALKKKD